MKDTNGNIICLVDDFESYRVADFILEPSSGNGQSDSTASGDDQQIVSSGSPAEGGQIVVDPGNDDILDSVPGGDDFIDSLHARFNNPGVAGTSQGLALEPDATAVTEEQAYSGSKSLKVQWAYLDAANDRSVLRLTTNKSITPPSAETFLNGNPVMPIELDGELCDGTGDVVFSVMIRLEPPEVPGDCDVDGDVDMHDIACAQVCTGSVVSGCETFDVAPKNNPDGIVDGGDYMLVQYLVIGPIQ